MTSRRRPSPHESMHSGHRILTPPAFAAWLLARVRWEFGVQTVAALYVALRGPYVRQANVEAWPAVAEAYPGPHPIIAHPPCGPWGPCRPLCKRQTRQGGLDAIELVHRWGGVVEQPIRSRLFREHGRRGGRIEVVDQADWGFPYTKETQLYWVGRLSAD